MAKKEWRSSLITEFNSRRNVEPTEPPKDVSDRQTALVTRQSTVKLPSPPQRTEKTRTNSDASPSKKRIPTTILFVYASKHGSTMDIANTITGRLKEAGFDVDVFENPGSAPSPIGYSAAVLGSAVYFGHWLSKMKRYYNNHAIELKSIPHVWLFSTGPVGQQTQLAHNTPAPVDIMRKELNVKGHVVFPGKLDRHNLSFAERAVTTLVKAKPGDYRDWEAIENWAESIVYALKKSQKDTKNKSTIKQRTEYTARGMAAG